MRVLGRVERFGGRLQVQVRAVEAAPDSRSGRADADAAARRRRARRLPRLPRGRDHATPGSRPSSAGMLSDDGIRSAFRALPAAGADGHHGYAGGLLEHTVGVATLCRETAQLHPRLRHDLLLAAALLHDVGRTARARPRAGVPPDGGRAPARPRPSRPAPDRGAVGRPRRRGPRRAPPRGCRPPRPAGGAHGRGRGALPREPARRAGGDPAGRRR